MRIKYVRCSVSQTVRTPEPWHRQLAPCGARAQVDTPTALAMKIVACMPAATARVLCRDRLDLQADGTDLDARNIELEDDLSGKRA